MQYVAEEPRKRLTPRAYYTRWMGFGSLLLAFGIPFWYLAVRMNWYPNEVPNYPWLWSLPTIICFVLFTAQIFWTLRAATADSDDLGMGKDWMAQLAVWSCIATAVAMFVLWTVEKYTLGWFQIQSIVSFTVTAMLIHQFSSWIRRLVNRRTFAGTSPNGDA